MSHHLARLCQGLALGLLLSGSLAGAVSAQSIEQDADVAQLVVATKPLEPFVFLEPQLRGFSIDVWNELAQRMGVETIWLQKDTVQEILDAVEAGEADAAIAGISITTSREIVLDFSHPYFDSGLQIATTGSQEGGTFRSLTSLAARKDVLLPLLGLVGLIAIVSHLVWWVERSDNPDFPHSYREGIWEAFWWSTVNVVTGGEAVKDIRRPLSRLLALMWMIVGLLLMAYVTARATTVLTVQELEGSIAGLEDLADANVVTIEGTSGAEFLSSRNIDFRTRPNVDEALNALVTGDAEAVVYDAPVLAYRTNTDFQGRAELVGSVFAPDPYGIAVAQGSELREQVNESLLSMAADGTLDSIHLKWFGEER